MNRKIIRVIPIVLLSLGAIAFGVQAAAGPSSSDKNATNPEAGLSDAQRFALQTKAHARNETYLRDFVAKGSDPRSLPVIEVHGYQAAPATVQKAVQAADLVVHAKVRAVRFQSRAGALPLTTTTVDVLQATKGQPAATITVQQIGGPVAQETGGALAHLANDPLLLPGDEAILLLTRDTANVTVYRTVIGAGVNLISANGVQAQEDNPFADKITGRSTAEVLRTLKG